MRAPVIAKTRVQNLVVTLKIKEFYTKGIFVRCVRGFHDRERNILISRLAHFCLVWCNTIFVEKRKKNELIFLSREDFDFL